MVHVVVQDSVLLDKALVVGVYESIEEAKEGVLDLTDCDGRQLREFLKEEIEWSDDNVAVVFSGLDKFTIYSVEIGETQHYKPLTEEN